jgi:hypothetical protein
MVDMLIIPIRSFHNVYIYVLKYHIILDPINTRKLAPTIPAILEAEGGCLSPGIPSQSHIKLQAL